MNYQVPQNINRDKIFIVNRSEINGRLDAHYNKPSYTELWHLLSNQNYELTNLRKNSICLFSGITPKSGGDAYVIDGGIPFVRSGDYSETNVIDFSQLLQLREDIHRGLMRNSQLRKNDLLIAIVGATIGKVGVYQYDIEANINQAICAVRLKEKLNPYYVQAFFQTSIGQKIIERIKRPVARANINIEEVGNLPIPMLDFYKQQEIIRIMEEGRISKEKKCNEAQRLLDSIDDYLLNELGIEMSNSQETSIKNRMFTINLNSLERDRLDSNYFDEKYRNILNSIHNGKYELDKLNNVTSFLSTGQTPKSSYYTEAQTEYPIIKAGSYSGFEIDLKKVAYTINKQSFSVQKGDIFILSAAHQAEYIAKQIYYLYESPLPNTSFVGELLCVRANKSVNSMYLYSLLSTTLYKTLLNREKRGQTSHLYSQDVKRVMIPIPPHDKQNEIAEHIEAIHIQAKTLQEEGKRILENAKRKVERMIINWQI